MTWWLATVIVSATYTANLAAFLSASRSQTTVRGVEDLAAQDDILYGTNYEKFHLSISNKCC